MVLILKYYTAKLEFYFKIQGAEGRGILPFKDYYPEYDFENVQKLNPKKTFLE